MGSAGGIVWLTGIPGAGKTTIGSIVREYFIGHTLRAELLDADELRKTISKGLGWSRADRAENVSRIAFVARLLARNGVWAIVAAVSPHREDRTSARREAESDGIPFVEVLVRCPPVVAEGRDMKGIWAKARSGSIRGFTGLDAPYEESERPEIVLETDKVTASRCASVVVAYVLAI